MSARPSAAISALLFLAAAAARGAEPVPVNPHASREARALLDYVYAISGHQTLAGQHNYPNTIARWTDRAYDLTGKYPALFGQDFGFQGGDDKDSTLARPALIAEVERQYRNGAVVTLTWHAVPPGYDEPVSFHENIQSHLSDFEWRELTTPGTDLYKRWCAQVDVIAGYLKQLRDAHVPVLWRPYHEVNGNWFWWGGRPGQNGSAALYRPDVRPLRQLPQARQPGLGMERQRARVRGERTRPLRRLLPRPRVRGHRFGGCVRRIQTELL